MIHELKVRNEFFVLILTGEKTFEVRSNDRDFQVGDFLALNEIDEAGRYTGCCCLVHVDYILDSPEFCKERFVILSISRCEVTRAIPPISKMPFKRGLR